MALPVALMAGSTALQAFGALQEGKAAADGAMMKGRAEQQSAEYNARSSEIQAASERDAAGAESSDFFRREMRGVSAGRAARGATGVIGSTGSPLLVDEATVAEVALGASRLMHAGEGRARRMEDDAILSRERGRYAMEAASHAASSAKTASYLKAGTTILRGGAQMAGWGQ
jgi:hypothetical protein